MSNIIWNQPLVAKFFAYFKPTQRLHSRDILFLICCPAHLSKEVEQERGRKGITPCEASSQRKMIPDRDKAFVSVSGGISASCSQDLENIYLWLVLYSTIKKEAKKKSTITLLLSLTKISRSWIILVGPTMPVLFQGKVSLFFFFVFWFQAILWVLSNDADQLFLDSRI